MYNHLYIEQFDVHMLILRYFYENENIHIRDNIYPFISRYTDNTTAEYSKSQKTASPFIQKEEAVPLDSRFMKRPFQ